jgi:hypothetical protein
VLDRRPPAHLVQVRGERVRFQPVKRLQERDDLLPPDRPLARQVQLHAVARAEHHRLDALKRLAQLPHRLRRPRRPERQPLAHVQRRGGVVEADEEE